MSTLVAYSSVDVLNASYMPLAPTQLSRAIKLVLDGQAVVEEADESRIVRSNGGVELPFPKVIRMLRYIDVPFTYQEEFFSRAGVLRRDNYTCGYCGIRQGEPLKLDDGTIQRAEMTHDHILPRSRGGGDVWMNAITACKTCNWMKADNTPEEVGMKLLFPPRVPMRIYLRADKPRRKKKS